MGACVWYVSSPGLIIHSPPVDSLTPCGRIERSRGQPSEMRTWYPVTTQFNTAQTASESQTATEFSRFTNCAEDPNDGCLVPRRRVDMLEVHP